MSVPEHLPPGLWFQPGASAGDLVAAVLAAPAERRGHTVRVGFVGHDDRGRLLRRLGRALAFPPWYGANWDALSDCLHDLSWLPTGPRLVVIEGAGELRARHADVADTLVEILARACWYWSATDSPLTLLLAG